MRDNGVVVVGRVDPGAETDEPRLCCGGEEALP